MPQPKLPLVLKLALGFFLALAVAYSQSETPAPLIRSNSRLVLLDVAVTDKTGHSLRGLTQKDFTVLENGTPQKILSVESQSTEAPLALRPRTILLLDELNLRFSDLAYARDKILAYLQISPSQQQPTALMAVGLHGLTMVQDFTQDNTLLENKLKALAPVNVNPADGYMDPLKTQEHAQVVLSALSQMARAAVGSPSSLNVIWFTAGFPGLLQTSSHSEGLEAGLRNVANLLMQSRMRLYTINPAGVLNTNLSLSSGRSSSSRSNRPTHESAASQLLGGGHGEYYEADEMLNHMTDMMGGKSYFRRNDIDVALSEAVGDSSTTYAVSYSPANTDFNGEYRKIEVQTDIEGASARTRRGYYAVGEAPSPDPALREAKLVSALASPLAYSGWNLTCPLTFDPATYHMKGQMIVTPKGGAKEEDQTAQTLRAQSFSDNGKVLDSWSWHVNWKNSWTNRVVNASFDKVLNQKARVVRFLVSDPATDRIGTCEYRIP